MSREAPTDPTEVEPDLRSQAAAFESFTATDATKGPAHGGSEVAASQTPAQDSGGPRADEGQTRVIWAITAAVVAIALTLQIVWVPDYRPAASPFELPWWMFILAFAAAEVFIVHLPVRRDTHTISLSELATVIGFAFVSPHMLIAARVAGSGIALGIYRRQRLVKLAFNLALFYLDLVVAVGVYRAVLGDASPNSPAGWAAALVAAAAAVVVSAGLVTTIVWLHDRERSRANILRSLAAGSLIPIGTSLVGVLCMIVLWDDPRTALVLMGAAGLFYLFIRTYGRLSKRHDDLRAIYSFRETIHAGLNDDEMQGELLGAAQEHLRARIAELVIRDSASQEYLFARLGEDGELTRGVANESRMARLEVLAAPGSDPLSFRRKTDDPSEAALQASLVGYGFETGLAAPLFLEDELIGVIAVGNRLGPIDVFDDADHALIEAMAAHSSLTIERLRLTESLQREVETNKALLDSKDALLASVSHELRTPLTGILGFAELLRDSGQTMPEEERTSMVSAIAAEALDLTNLVEDLLTAARSSSGRLVVTPTTVELKSLVERVLESNAPEPPHTVQLRGGDARAIADPARVRQVVRNLLTNAERYGGSSILVTIDTDGGFSRISVADNGGGVPSDDAVESIFEPYQSAHHAERKVSSVGIGLTISRALARLMNGDLTYRREFDWTVFELTLPGPHFTFDQAPSSPAPLMVPDATLRRRAKPRPAGGQEA